MDVMDLGGNADSTLVDRASTPLNFLVTIGILPNVNFISQVRDANSAISARFRT